MADLLRYWHTLRHLTARQWLYQLRHRLGFRPSLKLPNRPPGTYRLAVSEADAPVVYRDGAFTFLNKTVPYQTQTINWNDLRQGRLWAYHVAYFDYLNQSGLSPETGLRLMRQFIEQMPRLTVALEPYPTSLRIGNWIQFLSRHRLTDAPIATSLWAQAHRLYRQPEYHLGGNHLLENGIALLWAGLFFREERWYRKARWLLQTELGRQILPDGAHYERSPMYQQLLLNRLLDVYKAIRADSWQNDNRLADALAACAGKMLGWLDAIEMPTGAIPLLNDTAPGIAPTTARLRQKATALGIDKEPVRLNESGVRVFRRERYTLLADVGTLGPDEQPGHAHAGTLGFEVWVDDVPLLTDTGTSTYEANACRAWERSTAAHNTVSVAGQNSSDVWAAFRVGRRARVQILTDTADDLLARHDGYRHLGVWHQRHWHVGDTQLRITDTLLGNPNAEGVAHFHIAPIHQITLEDKTAQLGPVMMRFESEQPIRIRILQTQQALGFNKRRPAQCVAVRFTHQLQTTLLL